MEILPKIEIVNQIIGYHSNSIPRKIVFDLDVHKRSLRKNKRELAGDHDGTRIDSRPF